MAHAETLTDKFADRIRKEIRTGRWSQGPLPSERELTAKYQVSRVTIRRSLKLLCEENLVRARPGKGYYVVPGAESALSVEGRRVVLFLHCHEDEEHRPDALHAGILRGAMAEAERNGLELYATSQTAAVLRRTLAESWEGQLRGVLLDWAEPNLAGHLVKTGVPFVVVETELGDLPVTTVIQDNVGGMRQGLDLLLANGHRRIAMVVTDVDAAHPRQRLQGYREWLLQRGIGFEPSWVATAPETAAGGQEAAATVLDARERPTAILVANRAMLGGVVDELSRRGLRCPADVALVVWGPPGADEPAGALTDVSYITWDREEMGRMAMAALEERVKTGRPERIVVRIPTTLVVRGSVAVLEGKA